MAALDSSMLEASTTWKKALATFPRALFWAISSMVAGAALRAL